MDDGDYYYYFNISHLINYTNYINKRRKSYDSKK